MKVIFLHGLASSGAFKTAAAIRTLLEPCEVVAPDLPIEPFRARALIDSLCLAEKPDLIVGLSWGGFWAQQLRGYRRVLINPSFHTSRLLKTMTGEVDYLSPRKDGAKSFTLTSEICEEYEKLEAVQFDGIGPEEIVLVDGMFADEDERVRQMDEFELHYPGRAHSYPGRHLPTFADMKNHILPFLKNEIH